MWNRFYVKSWECNNIPVGKDMTRNTIPEGAAIKCGANTIEVFRSLEVDVDDNPTIATSWDPTGVPK